MKIEYTRDVLISVLESYVRMIERDNGKYSVAVLDDIHASIKHVLKEVKQ